MESILFSSNPLVSEDVEFDLKYDQCFNNLQRQEKNIKDLFLLET